MMPEEHWLRRALKKIVLFADEAEAHVEIYSHLQICSGP
jgi:hypothetical protein